MNSALRCEDPVVVLEHVDLYASTGHGPGRRPRLLPAGRQGGRPPRPARERHRPHLPGDDAATCWRPSRQLGTVDAEVIDLRWLDRASIDWDTIGASITKTNNVLIAEQGARRHVVRRLAGRRDPAPVLRLAGPAGAAGDRRRGVAEHQQGARARRDRAEPTRSSAELAEIGEVLTMARCCACPRSRPNATEAVLHEMAGRGERRLRRRRRDRDRRDREGRRRRRGRAGRRRPEDAGRRRAPRSRSARRSRVLGDPGETRRPTSTHCSPSSASRPVEPAAGGAGGPSPALGRVSARVGRRLRRNGTGLRQPAGPPAGQARPACPVETIPAPARRPDRAARRGGGDQPSRQPPRRLPGR